MTLCDKSSPNLKSSAPFQRWREPVCDSPPQRDLEVREEKNEAPNRALVRGSMRVTALVQSH